MISTAQLDYNAATNTFIADISDLEGQGFRWERAYPDACDLGITVVSHVTGKPIMFVVEKEEWGGGDLLAWRLKPAQRFSDLRVASMRVIIYND